MSKRKKDKRKVDYILGLFNGEINPQTSQLTFYLNKSSRLLNYSGKQKEFRREFWICN